MRENAFVTRFNAIDEPISLYQPFNRDIQDFRCTIFRLIRNFINSSIKEFTRVIVAVAIFISIRYIVF